MERIHRGNARESEGIRIGVRLNFLLLTGTCSASPALWAGSFTIDGCLEDHKTLGEYLIRIGTGRACRRYSLLYSITGG
jgi:hypothetical protein